jgi:hypothetical protein
MIPYAGKEADVRAYMKRCLSAYDRFSHLGWSTKKITDITGIDEAEILKRVTIGRCVFHKLPIPYPTINIDG